MPSKSKKQHNLMAAVANNPKFAKKVGIPQSVGKDYVEADKGRKFRSGGMASCGTKRMSKGGMAMAAGKGYRRGGKTEIEPKMTTYKSRVKTDMPRANGNGQTQWQRKCQTQGHLKATKLAAKFAVMASARKATLRVAWYDEVPRHGQNEAHYV
jgi:hypothetical protein